jgi:RNA polymerase sigma-70 factor (ECF subfamily)
LVDNADLELDFLKAEYREQFKQAFAKAVRELPARDRNLLRQSVVHSLTIDQLGALYHVDRSTAARWLARAREQLFKTTRANLLAMLHIDQGEFESIMNLIRSRLDVSLHRLLLQPSHPPRTPTAPP